MKMMKSMLVTIFCAAAILGIGYIGIVFLGENILENPAGPEPVTITSNISNLFYSQFEDDIQLYPWNYYPEEVAEESRGIPWFFEGYNPYIENDLFYTMIAVAAQVDACEVSQWYGEQEKTILESMVPGNPNDDQYLEVYFYDEVIRLNGKDYQVKIACEDYRITSFSCIQCREEGIKESEEWNTNRELLTERMKDSPSVMMELYYVLREIPYSYYGYESWYWYVELYAGYLMDVGGYLGGKAAADGGDTAKNSQDSAVSKRLEEQRIGQEAIEAAMEKERAEKEGSLWNDEGEDISDGEVTYAEETIPIQVIELQDSILILMESDATVGLYYDPMEQRIVGFHFF